MDKTLHEMLCDKGYQPESRAELKVADMLHENYKRYEDDVKRGNIESFAIIPEKLVPDYHFSKGTKEGYIIYIKYPS